ncbi:MAG: 50S ribosomal protein L10 [Candidatus Heimdallarchaeaceae archaeon]
MRKGEVKPEKIKAVEDLAKLISNYNVVGILNLYKTPASVLQKTKTILREKAVIKVAKKSIIIRALEKAGKGKLKEFVKDYPALILTNQDPFKVYNFLQKKKIPAFAKPGDIAEKDIEVKAGPTDLMPGPAISTLTKVKIPAKVEGGKIAIMKDKVVCKAGEKISLDLASALQLLKLKPMEIGLNIIAFEEKGIIYTKEQLLIDEEKVFNDFQIAVQNAFNLSINSGYPTKETISFMITKAFLNAKQLGLEAGIIEPGVIEDLIAKAKAQAEALKEKVG